MIQFSSSQTDGKQLRTMKWWTYIQCFNYTTNSNQTGTPVYDAICCYRTDLEKTTRQTRQLGLNFSSRLRAKELDYWNKLKLFEITLQKYKFGKNDSVYAMRQMLCMFFLPPTSHPSIYYSPCNETAGIINCSNFLFCHKEFLCFEGVFQVRSCFLNQSILQETRQQ